MSAPVAKATNPSTNVDPKSAPLKEIPDILIDPRTFKKYTRGRFLGKGGFAKCYEITDMETKEVFAGKVVPKSMILKPHQREKMSSEIAIHKSLDNPHIVGFHGFFEDDDFVFVVLEICRRRSLLELHKRRKAVTEPEARYYMMQLVKGCQYLHDNRVIHRDLKLGNIFLSDDMDVKIGDFGLATKIEFEGERKKTLCGTPNYIAPEVLCKKGHSFEVDVWSLGCILYTLLVGKPPFETTCLKETYNRIKKNNYTIPWQINPVAASLIKRMLHADPSQRPTVSQLQTDEFFTEGYTPLRLPTTCLTVPPRFSIAPSSLEPGQRRPLTALNNKGYQLCDNSVGVLFNDCTRMIMYADGDSLQYIDKMAAESYLSVRSYPATLSKKITLLKYFRNYMSEHLLKAGANITPRDGDELARLPYLGHWFRTKSAIVLHLTNGTVQINFFQDHTKLILCPLMGAVSFIDEKRDFRTYKTSLIQEFGCCKELASRMSYARLMVAKLLSCKSSTPR
ncbi:serine/threonine-protein kinase PLK1 isoform X2 [Salmo salar]|uniref:Serine/threonine-protein kinase PLK n=1 Tax=Salmo salar TaxID=8030 RepID=A0ABM3EF13_SALSA|nr:serine/threonine-protein kinase PLK1 isoform X2 [Salmo salar]